MTSKKVHLIFALSLALLMVLAIGPMPGKVEAAGPQKGPRAPGLEIKFLPDSATMYTALVAGELEYMGMLTATQFANARTIPEISCYLETTYTMQNEAVQCNYTNPYYPDRRSPTNEVNFRKALNHLVDKDWISEEVYEGLSERIDVVVAAPSKGWMNTSLIGENYPYPYSSALAVARLEDPAIYGSAENGWYDYDDDDTRNYPLDWDGVEGEIGVRDEPNIDPLHYWIYDDPPARFTYAHAIAEELRAIGIPVIEHVSPFQVINDQCWCLYKYHLSSDGWSVGRFPTYQWFFFASYLWMPGLCGANAYTGGADEPWSAELDAAVEGIQYAATIAAAKNASLYAQYLRTDKYCVGMIPIRSSKGFYASRNLLGRTKFFGGGTFNWATEMNAYRADDPNAYIRVTTDPPSNINTIYCMWTNGYFVMQRTWEDLIELNPIDPMYEMPCAAQDWDTGEWYDAVAAEDKTVVKWWLTPGVNYVEPVTGDVLDSFNASMQIFPCWYMYQTPDAWWAASFKDIHHIRLDLADPLHMEVYWDAISCFFYQDAPGSTNLGMYSPVYKQYPIVEDPDNLGTAGPAVRTYVEGVNLTTPGDLGLPLQTAHAPVEILSIVEEGVGALTPSDVTGDNDYEIVLGDIHIYKDIADAQEITVTYWARGPEGCARGPTVADVPWNQIYCGCGKWVMTAFDTLTGAVFKANRNHHWTTPPLGETDWYWWPIEGPKPRAGSMKVNIYDVTLATGCYGTSGKYYPDALYNPTADLAPSADGLPGKIDIYDVVTITANYGAEFWNLT